MAVSIDRATRIITVPQADLIPISPGVFEHDLLAFRLELNDISDNAEALAHPITHENTAPVTLSGTTGPRTLQIINGYSVEYENGQYAVNLTGANSNVADVTVVNQVSVRANNSFGLVTVSTGSGLSNEERKMLEEIYRIHGLLSGQPLLVTDTSRSAGDISQTIFDDGTTSTVNRT